MPKSVVIGGGFGGMATALRLRALGHDVTLVERQPDLGGRARIFHQDGFSFDAGPTVITAPHLFAELFELFNKRLEDYVSLKNLELWYRFYFPDGHHLDYCHAEKMPELIADLSPQDAKNYPAFLAHTQEIFKMAYEGLASSPMHDFKTTLMHVPDMLRLGCFNSVYHKAGQYFKDPRVRQAFSIQPLLLGGNPLETTSIYLLIHALEQKWGVHFPEGGTGALVLALEKLMREENIEILTHTTINGVKRRSKSITSLSTDTGAQIQGDYFIGNIDPQHLYQLPGLKSKLPRMGSRKQSFGLFVWYFGTNRRYEEIPHHSIIFGRDFEKECQNLFRQHRMPEEDFSIYLHRPTATDPKMAPEGCDAFYALVPVPNMKKTIPDWQIAGESLRHALCRKLQETLLPGLSESLVTEHFVTPHYFQNELLSPFGSGFSIAPVFYQSGYFRPHNKSGAPANLFLSGAGTHPGAGLPGVLNSAKVVETLVKEASISNVA